MHRLEEIGPALARLRKKARLTQQDVADIIKRSKATAAAIERPQANPRMSNVLRYLAAIGATLAELHVELGGDQPVARTAHASNLRLRDEPHYRRSMADKLERFGTGSSPEIELLAARVAKLEERLGKGEEPEDDEQPRPNGSES